MRCQHLFKALADDAYVLKEQDLTKHVTRVVRFFMNGVGVKEPA